MSKKEWVDYPIKTVTFSEPNKKEDKEGAGDKQSNVDQEQGKS